ncbi:Copper-transporting ATPase [Venturia nashicola]|uniref:Copper-transporting ATPase n=1 Tax=Venturia nashicola TaxID=86259 RepID=A0A4Z1PDB0_9PEZI|nr:Copper-transporting ATPase [Venturia nashicola]TLD38690.1 Copper-transporting ATPase [Venturia nashicola]
MNRTRVITLIGVAVASLLLLASHLNTSNYNINSSSRSSLLLSDQSPAPHVDHSGPRAYATFLSTRITDPNEDDAYFTAARVLAYQFLRHESTKTNLNIPFIVLVAPHVTAEKQKILADEGATVIPVDLLEPDAETNWIRPGEERFIDQFTKLRLWTLTQYERILYLDADMLLMKSLDGIWDEPVANQISQTLPSDIESRYDDLLPENYTMVGVSDSGAAIHPFPPLMTHQLNGGFFLMRPSLQLYQYYVKLLNTPYSFDSGLMEQSLLNLAHNYRSRMPWVHFPPGKWNVNWPSWRDVEGGAATLHDKFWSAGNAAWIDRRLVEMWWRRQGEMEGFWAHKKLTANGA